MTMIKRRFSKSSGRHYESTSATRALDALLTKLEANILSIGAAATGLLFTGWLVHRAARAGSEEVRAALPAHECSYTVESKTYRLHRQQQLRPPETLGILQSAVGTSPKHLELPCYAGGADEGANTHTATSDRRALAGCSLLVEALCAGVATRAGSRPGPGQQSGSGSVWREEVGLRSSDVARLKQDGILVLDGALVREELQQIGEEIRTSHLQTRLRTNVNEGAARKEANDPSFVAVRSDRTFFLTGQLRASGQLPSGLRHAERLLRSLGACLEDDGFDSFADDVTGTAVATTAATTAATGTATATTTVTATATATTTAVGRGTHPEGRRAGLLVPDGTQLALYGGDGAFYRPHRDGYAPKWADGFLGWLRLRSVTLREVTAILYLNDNGPGSAQPWQPDHGGALRVYLEHGNESSEPYYVEIPPVGGRLVLFDSQRFLHEVRPSFRPRAAITVWFLANDEGHVASALAALRAAWNS